MEAKICIGIPSTSEWKADFGMCLTGLVAGTAVPPEPYSMIQLGISNIKGSILPQQRTRIVKSALQMEATHVCFIDSDMYFPPSLICDLLVHQKDIVACNCVTKVIPAIPTARDFHPDKPGGEVVYQQEYQGKLPLRKVWRVGTGIMLINLDVFRKLSEPWFPIIYDPTVSGDYVGEDWGFCEKAIEAGYEIWLDMFLSDEIGHVGNMVYTHAHVNPPELEIDDKVVSLVNAKGDYIQ